MAITSGQGNPHWTREEVALALELYFSLGELMPSKSDKEVIELSKFLRSLNIHDDARKNDTFRNPDGVAFKVGNLRAIATGKGLQNTAKMDKEVWDEFHADRVSLLHFCDQIRNGNELLTKLSDGPLEDDESVVFKEGKLLTRLHKKRERSSKSRKELIKRLERKGDVFCRICKVRPNPILADLGLKMFECHHIVPLSSGNLCETKLSDLALLCANCHRLIHGLISKEKRWISVEEAAELLSGNE